MTRLTETLKVMGATALVVVMFLAAESGLCGTPPGGRIDGKEEFIEHCAVCHPNGKNIVNVQKPLSGKALQANGIGTVNNIVAKMRIQGPGITRFVEQPISDPEAKAIAAYVLRAIK